MEMKQVTLMIYIFVIGHSFLHTHGEQLSTSKLHTPDEGENRTKHHSVDSIPSSSEFSEIRRSKAFVDKTLFLHEWLTERPKHWFVTAPPGFGKSALAKMTIQFLNASFEIVNGQARFLEKQKTPAYAHFEGTNIFKNKSFFEEHFQNYAVVYIDLGPLRQTTEAVFIKEDDFRAQDFHKYFRAVIKKMMSYYSSLHFHQSLTKFEKKHFKEYLDEGMEKKSRPITFWNSASFLMHLLRKILRLDVIVIVDNYDAMCMPSMYGDLFDVLRPYLASYLINFSRIIIENKKASVLYLGSFKTVEMMLKKPGTKNSTSPIIHTAFSSDEKIATYFGLTEQEVADILSKYSMENHFPVVNDLLNGHAILRSSLTIFNTKYVLSYIEHGNSSPSAFKMPLTVEVLNHYKKLFTSDWVTNVLYPCIYKDRTQIKLFTSMSVSFASFTRLTKLNDNDTEVHGREKLSQENTMSFIKILQFLGLISVIEEKTNVDVSRATSRCDAEFMNDYLYRSGTVQRFYKMSPEQEQMMVHALKSLAPNNDSIQSLGEAIHNIIRVKVPKYEDQLKFLMYVFSKKVATQYSEDFSLEARISAPTMEHSKSNGVSKPDVKDKIDIILLQKNKGIGIILISKLDVNVTSILEEIVDRKYSEILDSDLRFSKLKIKDKLLVGISVTQDKVVEIAAEVWHKNEKTRLKHVILNNTSAP